MIVLTAEQCSRLLWRDQYPDARLRPMLLSDGRYGVPETVLDDPRHARWHSVLREGSIEPNNTLTVVATGFEDNNFRFTVDGKTMTLVVGSGTIAALAFRYPQRGAFDIPAANVYQFICQYNNQRLSFDWGNNRRRSELTQPDETGPQMGDTWWVSWSTILTDERSGITGPNGTLIHQWFKTAVTGSVAGESGPFVYVGLDSGNMTIAARSSADVYPAQNTYYNEPFEPPSGTPTHFVMSGLLGEEGHLNAWINGVQVVDEDCPLGFYAIDDPNDPAYLHIAQGIYQANIGPADVVYHANLEFGTADLSARVDNPLPINVPPEGWGAAVAYPQPTGSLYPATDLYPVTNLYPR